MAWKMINPKQEIHVFKTNEGREFLFNYWIQYKILSDFMVLFVKSGVLHHNITNNFIRTTKK